jgi:hypothetical protein
MGEIPLRREIGGCLPLTFTVCTQADDALLAEAPVLRAKFCKA